MTARMVASYGGNCESMAHDATGAGIRLGVVRRSRIELILMIAQGRSLNGFAMATGKLISFKALPGADTYSQSMSGKVALESSSNSTIKTAKQLRWDL